MSLRSSGGTVRAMRTVLPTGDVARYCQTVHCTVRMWIKTDALRLNTTPGWHHGIRRDDFLTLLPSYRLPVLETVQDQARACILVVAPDYTAVDMHTRTLHHVPL